MAVSNLLFNLFFNLLSNTYLQYSNISSWDQQTKNGIKIIFNDYPENYNIYWNTVKKIIKFKKKIILSKFYPLVRYLKYMFIMIFP